MQVLDVDAEEGRSVDVREPEMDVDEEEVDEDVDVREVDVKKWKQYTYRLWMRL